MSELAKSLTKGWSKRSKSPRRKIDTPVPKKYVETKEKFNDSDEIS